MGELTRGRAEDPAHRRRRVPRAGKPTLLNRLLRDAGGRRLGVLVNDFGAINVDAELVESRDGDIPGYRQDAVVVVADAETVQQRAADDHTGPQVRGQPRAADLLVLNKTDLVTPAALADTRGWPRELAGPSTALVEASLGEVPVEVGPTATCYSSSAGAGASPATAPGTARSRARGW